jgi:hypothetical protein
VDVLSQPMVDAFCNFPTKENLLKQKPMDSALCNDSSKTDFSQRFEFSSIILFSLIILLLLN